MDLFARIARSISHAQTAAPAEVSSGGTGIAVGLLSVLILLWIGLIVFRWYLKRK